MSISVKMIEMNVNKCISLFKSLQQFARREAVSKLMDTLEADEFQVVLRIIDHQLENNIVVNGNMFVKKEVSPATPPYDKLKFEITGTPTKKLPKNLGRPKSSITKSQEVLIDGNSIKKEQRSIFQDAPIQSRPIPKRGRQRSKSQTLPVVEIPIKKRGRPKSQNVPFKGSSNKKQKQSKSKEKSINKPGILVPIGGRGRQKLMSIDMELNVIKQGRPNLQIVPVVETPTKKRGRPKSQNVPFRDNSNIKQRKSNSIKKPGIPIECRSIKVRGRQKSLPVPLEQNYIKQGRPNVVETSFKKRGRPKSQNISFEGNSIKEKSTVKVESIKIEEDLNPIPINKNPNKAGRPKSLIPQALIPCPCCHRTFKNNALVKNHMLHKHKESDQLEEIMGKVRKKVKTENNNACQTCRKEFKWHWLLEQHISSDHENIRPFVCEVCAKSFKLKYTLKKHLLIHQDTLAHSCDLCEKRFRRIDHLTNHKRRHTGEHPFKCDKCDWCGPDSSSNVHHKKKHSQG